MALDLTKFACWSSDSGMSEGIKPSERGLNAALYGSYTNAAPLVLSIPIPAGTVIKSGTIFALSLNGRSSAGTVSGIATLKVDGTSKGTCTINGFTTTPETKTGTLTTSGDVTVSATVTLEWGSSGTLRIFYYHDDLFVGMDSTTTEYVPRTAIAGTNKSPAAGTHAAPTEQKPDPVTLTADLTGIYYGDEIYYSTQSDTWRLDAHAVGTASETYLDTAQALTTAFPAAGKRTISVTGGISAGEHNTYLGIVAKCNQAAVGGTYWEMCSLLRQISIHSLNGINDTYPELWYSDRLIFRWHNPNAEPSATELANVTWHIWVGVYSPPTIGFQLAKEGVGTWPASNEWSALASTLGFSDGDVLVWYMDVSCTSPVYEIQSPWGYFILDRSSTALRVTSPVGTLDLPAIITDTTPALTWTLGDSKTQAAYCVTAIDTADNSIHQTTGWVASATLGYTLASALSAGHTYALRVEARDTAQQFTYVADTVYVHVNDATISAPTLTAEADCLATDSVTLDWSAVVPADGDDLTYSVVLTGASGGDTFVRTFSTSETTLFVGHLPAAVWTWYVYAVDPYDMIGTSSASDTFAVTLTGAAPVCTPVTLAVSVDTTPISYWSYYDAEGGAQSHYQVVTASDAGFTTDVVDSGAVASTAMFYQHPALAAGTWHRKIRVKVDGDWSAYAADTFVIAAVVAQTDAWEIYRSADTTPVLIDPDVYPAGGLTITQPFDGPTSFSFTVNNFDGLQAGILDDDVLLLRVRDNDGNRMTFKGLKPTKTEGKFITVTAASISQLFGRWEVGRNLDHITLGEAIAAIITNPSGLVGTGTGIVCHCAEFEDPENPGYPIILEDFNGNNKTVQAWLSEWQKQTGARWYDEWNDADQLWHFHWFDPEDCPDWEYTLRDGIDYGAESDTTTDGRTEPVGAQSWWPTEINNCWLSWVSYPEAGPQLRILDGATVRSSMGEYANRIKYRARYSPPALPPGVRHWDDVWTEDETLWTPYADVAIAGDTTEKYTGTKSIRFTHTQTGPGSYNRGPIPFGYMRMPSIYRDWGNITFNNLYANTKFKMYLNGVYDHVWRQGQGFLAPVLHSGGEVGPTGGEVIGYTDSGSSFPVEWGGRAIWPVQNGIYHQETSHPGFDIHNVNAISFRLYYPAASGYPDWLRGVMEAGDTFETVLWLDNMWIGYSAGVTNTGQLIGKGGSPTGEFYVETAAVTAGTETPIEYSLNNVSMCQAEARALALLWLDIKSRAKKTVSGIRLPGVVNVPLRRQIPIALTTGPVLAGTYSLAQITWRPADAGGGWETELTLGDMPSDQGRAIQLLSHGQKTLEADTYSS